MSTWKKFIDRSTTRLSALARSLFLSRAKWRQRAEQAEAAVAERKLENEQLAQELEQARQEIEMAKERMQKLQQELQQAKESTEVTLPNDPVLSGHQFGPRMISLCINLARSLGLRPAVRALTEFFQWLGVKVRIPTYQAIRIWMQRLGIAEIKKVQKKNGRIWIADHSNQIGQEKVLVILAVDPDKLPPPGQTLDRSHVEVLAVVPKKNWKKEDVAKCYRETAVKFGTPRSVLVDGAPELRDAVEITKWPGKQQPIVSRDMKHFLSNRLEAILKKDPDFASYVSKQGTTRSAIQQTELGHFTPPGLKPKARFMNIKPLLNWGQMVHWYVTNPTEVDDGITKKRLDDKLGWIEDFGPALNRWSGLQEIISVSLTWINENGLYRGASRDLAKQLQGLAQDGTSGQLVKDVLSFVKSHEHPLAKGERLWLSTEIIESIFGTYKQFEGQQSKGGFTGLLPTFASLLRPTSDDRVRQCFSEVTVAVVQEWMAEHLPETLHGKRTRAYRRYRKATQQPVCATA